MTHDLACLHSYLFRRLIVLWRYERHEAQAGRAQRGCCRGCQIHAKSSPCSTGGKHLSARPVGGLPSGVVGKTHSPEKQNRISQSAEMRRQRRRQSFVTEGLFGVMTCTLPGVIFRVKELWADPGELTPTGQNHVLPGGPIDRLPSNSAD